jgi:hypothetical protein
VSLTIADILRRLPDVRPPDFDQGQNLVAEPQNVPNVAKPGQHKITRVNFRVSRLMEFCSMGELQNQTGHSVYDWPLVAAKELLDNALDACEEAEVAPEISVAADNETIIVQDNANGIDAATIKSVLNYAIRVSSREAYVSPTRGQQGNALKTVLAMGYVFDRWQKGEGLGVTEIESRGVKHRIEFRVDHVNNEPRISHHVEPSPVIAGTRVTVRWPPTRFLNDARSRFQSLVQAYASFNPHLTPRGAWCGEEFVNVAATNPDWEKWRPRDPTSAHWYNEARLERYLAAHVAHDRDHGRRRTVRDFIAEFRGLAGTAVQRRILNEIGCSHRSLADFFGVRHVNSAGVAKLLAAMKAHSKPVPPRLLGVIGEAHFKQRFLAAGGEVKTFQYRRRDNVNDDGVPYVTEFVFGLHKSGLDAKSNVKRVFVTGANWSAAISNPFRNFGSTGEGLETTLEKVRANASQPVICAGTSSTTHAGISPSRTPIAASAAAHWRSTIISARSRSRRSLTPVSTQPGSASLAPTAASAASCSAKRKASTRCGRR